MDPSLQIRKMPLDVKSRLLQHLDSHESWKKLMCVIPLILSPNTYECEVSVHNPPKYKFKHFKKMEDNATQVRTPADLLLREWGTSGTVRPTLGHLKYLLIKAKLYGAAEYLCVEVLKEEAPSRPIRGPAARVVVSPEELRDYSLEKLHTSAHYNGNIPNITSFLMDQSSSG